ncbi:MAG TPA: hypothetical protein PKL92_01660 [Aquaticitalea sp.]|nr:hypothetical protein [Aquaticitalea sp.]HNU59162.1 hypothetical protein [Aquaticitalea sp.]
MKRILFITTSSLAANPRLVKEVETLKHDFECYVLCFKHFDWGLKLSDGIVQRNPEVHFVAIDRKKQLLQTLVSKLFHRVARLCNPWFKKNTMVCAFASNDKTPQLLFNAFLVSKGKPPKMIIAHNIGAFYPAMRVAKLTASGLQLDIEDYHPGEALYFNKSFEKQNRMYIMQAAFCRSNTITYASEGIALECQKQFRIGDGTKQATILNAFEAKYFKSPDKPSAIIKCVWFSQHIGPNRGLEQIFEAAKSLDQVEFHLIGNPNMHYLEGMALSDNIKFHNSMKAEDLYRFLGLMDIGLALEDISADQNRNICLTNKIMAYAQAGLYILATDTFGQSQFLNALDYKAGKVIGTSLKDAINQFDPNLLDIDCKTERWQRAKAFSWDNEQLKLKALLQ